MGLPIVTGSHAAYARMLGAFGLVWWWLTIPYHETILGQTLPTGCFTNHYHRTEDTTHSDDTMCYVGLLRLYGCGDDRHLYDVGILFVWLDTVINECLGISDGVEVARVLC